MNLFYFTRSLLICFWFGIAACSAEVNFSSQVGWSGPYAQRKSADNVKTPSGEEILSWSWSKGLNGALPTYGFSGPVPVEMQGDVLAFWLRISQPVQRLEVVLNDVHGVGAERSVAELLGVKTIEAGHWYHVIWPFRLQPGWVRYTSNKVDWTKTVGATFYTWNDQWLKDQLIVELGPIQVLSFDELNLFFERHPDLAGNDRTKAWRVLTDENTGHMMEDYHRQRVEEAIASLHAQFSPEVFIRLQDQIRQKLAATYLMPKTDGAPPLPTLVRTEQVGNITVELQLLNIRPGVYSTAEIYLPNQNGKVSPVGKKYPPVLMLPGHGDVAFSDSVQDRCLAFAEHGYITMLAEPFGQDELDDNLAYCEDLDSQATAFLWPTGQSLLGRIMSDHLAELTYFMSRNDVDPGRLVVTGVSMGGTHSIWLPAIDTRVHAAVPDGVGRFYTAPFSNDPLGMCDIMFGVYRVADQEMIYSLLAPRPLLEIIPSVQAPLTEEGARLVADGVLSSEEAEKKYPLNPAQVEDVHQYVHAVYNLLHAPRSYRNVVVEGPHDYTKAMRETTLGFLDWAWDGFQGKSWQAEPEGALPSIHDRAQAMATFKFWPDGNRPKAILGPTAYTQRETLQSISQLPPPPQNLADWKKAKGDRQGGVLGCLGVDLNATGAAPTRVGKIRAEHGALQKWIVHPEVGIKVPMLLFAPDDGVNPDGRVVILLHPEGMIRVSVEERQKLTAGGAWVVCADLRGIGETRYNGEVGGYIGMHDYDVGCMALKLGETLAGYWTRDLLAVVHAIRTILGPGIEISVRAEREMGFAALLAAIHSKEISDVETTGLLASYYSAQGYGLPYVYGANRPLGGYGTMVPCIPSILKYADIPQLAAMIAPRTLTIRQPLWASGMPLSQKEIDDTFLYARKIYGLYGATSQFATTTEAAK